MRDVWVLVNGQAFNLLSLSTHESFTMYPTVNRIDKEGEWVAPDGTVYKYKFSDEQLAALQARNMALVLGTKDAGDQEPGSIHGHLAWNGARYVVVKSEDGSSVTGTADTNDDPNIPKELQIPELFQGQRLKKTYAISDDGRVVVTNGVINLTGKYKPGQVGDHHWQNVSAEPPLPADASEQERKARDERDAAVREQVVLTIPDAKLVYETDPTKQGRWPTGKVIRMGTPQAQAAHLDFTKGQAIGALGGISYNNPSNIYDNVFYLGPVKKGQKYRYITIYNPVSNKTIVIKADVRYTHAVVFTPFWDGARGTLCVELQTAPTNMFKLQKQVRDDVNHELDPELGEAVKGLVQGPHEEVELQTTMWAVEGKVDIDQLIVQEEGAAAADGKILADIWPEGVTAADKSDLIRHRFIRDGLSFSALEHRIATIVAREPENTMKVTLDLGDGRRYTEVLPAGQNDRDLAVRWLASWAYALVIWKGRVAQLKVLVEPGAKAVWNRQEFFAALQARLIARYNSDPAGTKRTLQGLGNYGRPINIQMVDALPVVDTKKATAKDAEFPNIIYMAPEDFPGVDVTFDAGGQSTKVAVLLNGKTLTLPDELAKVSYGRGASAQRYVGLVTEHAQKLKKYLLDEYGVGVNSAFFNTPGAIEPITQGEVAPGIDVSGRMVTFATEFSHWSDAERDLARTLPTQLAQAFDAPVKAGNDMIGFASWLMHMVPGRIVLQGTLGSGYGTQFGDSLRSPQEGSHFEIVLSDDLPRSCEQLGLSTNAIIFLAQARGFDTTGIKGGKLLPEHVGKALTGDPNSKNYRIAREVFQIVGELLAEHLYLMSKVTGVTTLVLAGGIAQDVTGKLIQEEANKSLVAKQHGLKVELMTGDVAMAGAVGGTYAASRQRQARIARLAQSWGIELNGNKTAIQIAHELSGKLSAVFLSQSSRHEDQQRAAHDLLALRVWFPEAVDNMLYAAAQRIYQPKCPSNGPDGNGGSGSATVSDGAPTQDGGVNLNSLAASLSRNNGKFYFKRGFLTGREQGLMVNFTGERRQKTFGQIIKEDSGRVN